MSNNCETRMTKLSNGESLGYRIAGQSGPIIVFLHGILSSSKQMEQIMSKLADEYRLYAIDMRGFGRSSNNQSVSSLKEFADDIKFFADNLNLRDFTLAGWSMGGCVAMQYAADYPEMINRLILIDSVGIRGVRLFNRSKPGRLNLVDILMTRVCFWGLLILKTFPITINRQLIRKIWDRTMYNQNSPDKKLYEEYLDEAMLQRDVWEVFDAMIRFNISHEHNGVLDGNGQVDSIGATVMVIQGDRDLLVPREMCLEIHSSLGAKSRLEMLQDCGHSPFTDCLDEVVSLVRDFVR